jgi:hypothetical protein
MAVTFLMATLLIIPLLVFTMVVVAFMSGLVIAIMIVASVIVVFSHDGGLMKKKRCLVVCLDTCCQVEIPLRFSFQGRL